MSISPSSGFSDLNAAITFYKLLTCDFIVVVFFFFNVLHFLFLKVIVLLHQTITFILISGFPNADYLAVVGTERELHFVKKQLPNTES